MKKKIGLSVILGVLLVSIVCFSGCAKIIGYVIPDVNTPEGQFKTCVNSVKKIKKGLDGFIDINGTLDAKVTVGQALGQRTLSSDDVAKQEDEAYKYCDEINIEVDKSTGTSYTMTAIPIAKPECPIVATPTSVAPKNISECPK